MVPRLAVQVERQPGARVAARTPAPGRKSSADGSQLRPASADTLVELPVGRLAG
jgi:hypothetical protein